GFDAAKAGAARKQERDADAEFRARTVQSLRDSEAGPTVEGLPFHAVPIATAEVKLRIKIRKETEEMLSNTNFGGLDDSARTYRRGRETFPDGTWLLGEVYNGLQSDDQEPEQAWRGRITVLRDWTNARPESITARVALANEMVAYGWKARGT